MQSADAFFMSITSGLLHRGVKTIKAFTGKVFGRLSGFMGYPPAKIKLHELEWEPYREYKCGCTDFVGWVRVGNTYSIPALDSRNLVKRNLCTSCGRKYGRAYWINKINA